MAQFLHLPGVSGNFVSTPDNAAFDVVDLEMRIDFTLTDYTPAVITSWFGRWASGETWAYIGQNTSGVIRAQFETAGGGPVNGVLSTVALSTVVAGGARVQVRMTLDADNGAAGADVSFYYRTGGDITTLTSDVGWTQLGTTVTVGNTITLPTTTSVLLVGGRDDGTNGLWEGDTRRAIVYNAIGGTIVADFDADDFTVGDSDTDTAVDSTGKTWTISGVQAEIQTDVPDAPANPTATAISSTRIDVGWDDVATETGYRVERSDDGVSGWADVSGNLAADTTTYSNTGLDPETQYFYRVIAFNAAGDSDPSTVVNATTQAAAGTGNDLFLLGIG